MLARALACSCSSRPLVSSHSTLLLWWFSSPPAAQILSGIAQDGSEEASELQPQAAGPVTHTRLKRPQLTRSTPLWFAIAEEVSQAVGFVTERRTELLRRSAEKLLSSRWRACSVRVSDTTASGTHPWASSNRGRLTGHESTGRLSESAGPGPGPGPIALDRSAEPARPAT